MNDFKRAIEQVIWATLEKHYNVDRTEPRVLTYKHIIVQDPVGDLAQQLTNITEQLIKQAVDQLSAPPEETQESPPEDDDFENFGDYGGSFYYGGDD